MNHYPHHIGDFDRATRHLTRLERSIYRDLIELYYDTEQRLTLDRVALCRKIIARSDEEATAVEQALSEFFTETATGWYHKRCEIEIERYRNTNTQQARAGRASALKRAAIKQQAIDADSTPVATPVEQTFNQPEPEPEPEPEPIKASTPPAADESPAMFDTFWSLWPATDRRTQRAKCKANWKKHNLDAKADEILEHVAALKETEKWMSGFEPAPMTYLNGKQWEDGLPEIARSTQQAKPQFLTAQQQRDENNRRSTAEFLADDTPFFSQMEPIEGEFSNA